MKNCQLCPKCNGEGFIFSMLVQKHTQCHVCDGGKLINMLTGHPRLNFVQDIKDEEKTDESLLINILKDDDYKTNLFNEKIID